MKKAVLGMCLCLCLFLGAWCTTAVAAEDVRLISTAKDLFDFAAEVKADANQYAGKKAQLTRDIDLGGQTWTPIDAFSGELDGNGKTIRNFVVGKNSGFNNRGFFGTLNGSAKVHDLTLEDVAVSDIGKDQKFGTLVGTNYASTPVSNIHIKNVNATVTSADNSYFAGLICRTRGHVSNCTVENVTVTAPNGIYMAGGFVSILSNESYGKLDIENCTVNNFTLTVGGNAEEQCIGGFAAYAQTRGVWETWKNCHAKNINLTVSGGKDTCVSGFVAVPGAFINASNCSAQGTINASQMTDSNAKVGGFLADFGWGAASFDWSNSPCSVVTNCSADVDITSGGAVAGGFVAYTDASKNDGDNRHFRFENCTANGNVTNTNGIAGGFVGIANRAEYHNCKANGLVNGKTAGGFIGEVRDWKPTYRKESDKTNFKNTFGYYSNQILLDGCKAKGTVLGSEQAGGLIGNVGKSLNGTEAEGASGKLIVKNCTTAPSVIGAKKSTQVNAYMNSAANSKATETSGLSGKRTTATPTDAAATLAMDQNGDVTIPQGGADVEHTDDPALKWIPVDATILRDGSIRLPGAYHAPKTGVDGADKYMLLALASLLGMMALTSSRRKNAHR